MTHDELLAKINHIDSSADFIMDEAEQYFFKAVLAVVELHKPYESYLGTACLECSEVLEIPYPCHTIQAIVKGLNNDTR